MGNGVFQPKAFYRKFDSLLIRIGDSARPKEVLSLVVDELVQAFGADLGIRSGSVYQFEFGSYRMIKEPVGEILSAWPQAIAREDLVFELLARHKSYIYTAEQSPPWGGNSVAALVGDKDQYLLVFRLTGEWVLETLQFSVNTVKNTLNYSLSTSAFSADLQEAYEIQKSLLPVSDPLFTGYDISGRSVPAERVGGDLYDFNILDEDVLSFAIGDASGHGLPAALLARDVVTGLRMGIEHEMKIAGVIKKLNRVINQSRLSTRFISLVYGELERNGTMVYTNAGHPPPLHIKKDSTEKLDVGGTILGPLEETVFKRGFAFIDPGDVLVMFTDGIIEVVGREDEMFGTDRLARIARENRDEPSSVITDRVFGEIKSFGKSNRLKDDATLVVIRRLS